MKTILLLLLLPSFVSAQVIHSVEPIETKDYINLIRHAADSPDKTNTIRVDSTNSIRDADLTLLRLFNSAFPVRRIKISNGDIKVYNNYRRTLMLGASYSSTIEIKTINRLPALQNNYVQGRSQNGGLTWRGPETGEMFSYGPGIHSLEFDGSAYPYDINGKLVAIGSGNGNAAKIYDNTIFRTAVLYSQSLNIQSTLQRAGKNQWTFGVKLGQTNEQTFIKNNKNSSKNISASIGTVIKWLSISGTYSYLQNQFSNSNRNGFLNRVYQNSILTPVSFDNAQGNTISNNLQRSYSDQADNAEFLLNNNGNSYLRSQHNANLVVEKKNGPLWFKLIQSLENVNENSNEGYKAGAVNFPGCIPTLRKKNDLSYFLTATSSRNIHYSNYKYRSTASATYIFNDTKSKINYPVNQKTYNYQRYSHDFALKYLTTYDRRNFEAGIDLGNKFYFSNTAGRSHLFLPAIGSFIRFDGIGDYFSIKLVSSFHRFVNELPVDKSFEQVNLLRYSTQDAFQYFPVQEAAGFTNLKPIDQREWTGRIELSYRNNITLSGEVFVRNTKHDIFPVYENGNLVLKNIADHRGNGIELELRAYRLPFNSKTLSISSSLSFVTYKNIVTNVEDGYNFTPIAGFSNINKVIAKGEAFEAIAGNSYLRDGHNNILIGTDGYPLVNNQPKIIGDPTPDFIMKTGNSISWKKLTLNLDVEWRKGGEMWNGTQAALDYYGRSQNSATRRNTTNYVFPGYLENGHINNIPVNFYDPNLSLDKNRWIRYGIGGIAEEYIQKADNIRLNDASLVYTINFRKHIQQLTVGAYINNLILRTAYKGTDPNQLLYDQSNSSGLDFFNLPSTKTFGFTTTIQF